MSQENQTILPNNQQNNASNISKIYITGDTHGDIDIKKLTSPFFPPKGVTLTKQDFVIICGDFGAIWTGTRKDNFLLNWYDNKPWTTLFVDGNHENFNALNNYPIVQFRGGKAHKISDSIYHLMRGQVFTINNKTFFTFGGARSHDQYCRKENISWWPQELPSVEEKNEALQNLALHNNKVDYVITHDCPSPVLKWFYVYANNELSNFLRIIEETIDYKLWYFGHHHCDGEIEKFRFLYNLVVPLEEV